MNVKASNTDNCKLSANIWILLLLLLLFTAFADAAAASDVSFVITVVCILLQKLNFIETINYL